MDSISFDSNLIECYLNGEGDYDFLISMFENNMTSDEFDVLTEKIGAVLYNCLEDVASFPEELLARTLQILHATQDTKLNFTWEHCQAIMAPYLSLCTAIRTSHYLKMLYLTLNQLLQDSTFRNVIITDQTLLPVIAEMSEQLILIGDYESQAIVFETMIRISHKDRKHWAPIWFTDEELIDMFIGIEGKGFERTCRYFLNILNSNMEEQRVFSFIAQSVFVDDLEMKRPPECEFWVDFNYTSASISFYCVDHESLEEANDGNTSTTMWETVNLVHNLIKSCHLKMIPNFHLQEIITYLKCPYFENKSDSIPMKGLEKEPFVKILLQDCYKICHHLENIFKSSYKGQSIAMDNDISNCALDDGSKQNADGAVFNNLKNQRMIQNTVTHAMDSDEKHSDEYYPTSTPASFSRQENLHDNSNMQLTPLTTMVPLQTDMINVPDQSSPQNACKGKNALTGPHVIHNSFVDPTSQKHHQTLSNVISHGFYCAKLQVSIKQNKSVSLDGNASMEAMILQTCIKKNLAKMCTKDEVKSAPRKSIAEKSILAITGGKNCTSKFKKSPALKGKIRRGRTNLKPKVGKSLDTKTLNLDISKRKRVIISNKSILQEGSKQNVNDLNAEKSLDTPLVVNLTNNDLKTTSDNKKSISEINSRAVNKTKATTKDNNKAQEVRPDGSQDTSPVQGEDIANSEICHQTEIIEPKAKTVHHDTSLKGLARNASSKPALCRKRQVDKNVISDPLPITRPPVRLYRKGKVAINLSSNPLYVRKSPTSLYGESKMESNVTSNLSSMAKSSIPLHKRKLQSNHSLNLCMFALAKSKQMDVLMNQDNIRPHSLADSAVTSHDTTDNIKKSSSKPFVASVAPIFKSKPPLLESDPPLLESDLPLLESDSSLLESDSPSLVRKNYDHNTCLNPSHVSASSVPVTDIKLNNEDRINLNQVKFSKQLGRKRISLYNSDSEKETDFSSLKMDGQMKEEHVAIRKDAKFNAKQNENILTKKKRQPRVNAKKLSLKNRESSNNNHLPSSTGKTQSRQGPIFKKHASNDELYATPHDLSKSKAPTIIAVTPAERIPTGGGDDNQLDFTVVKGENISVIPGEKNISDDNSSDFNVSKPSKTGRVKKTNRKAAVSSMKKTKKILQRVKAIVETDSSSIVEVQQPVEPSINEVCKTANETVKTNEDSDSVDVSWLKGSNCFSFERPVKTWSQKSMRTPETQKTKKSKRNAKASAAVENKDNDRCFDTDNVSSAFEGEKKKKSNLSFENLETTDANVVTKSKSKRKSSIKYFLDPPNSQKYKKTAKPGSSLINHYIDRKITPKVPKLKIKDSTGSDSSYLPHVLLGRNDVPIEEITTTDSQQTEDKDIDCPPHIVEKTPIQLSKEPKGNKSVAKKRVTKTTQKKRKRIATTVINQKVSSNPSSKPRIQSVLSNNPADYDNESTTNNDNLSFDCNSNLSCAGSIKEKKYMLDHDMEKLTVNHLKKPRKHDAFKSVLGVPDGRKSLFKRFLDDASSLSSISRKKKKHQVHHSEKMANLARKKSYDVSDQSNKFSLKNKNSTTETSDSSINDGQSSSSKQLQNFSHFLESTANSDSSFSLTPHNKLPVNYDEDQRLLKKFMYTAQMLTNNLYNVMISIREDYLKILSDFDCKSQLMSGNFSSLKEYRRMKNQYWLKMRNRLKQLLDALDLYRLKERHFEKVFKHSKKHTGAPYAKAQSQATWVPLNNYEEKLIHDLKKVMRKSSLKLFNRF